MKPRPLQPLATEVAVSKTLTGTFSFSVCIHALLQPPFSALLLI